MAELLRPLGQVETSMAVLHELAAGTNQGVQGVRLRGRFEHAALARALRLLHARHQALRCVLRPQGEGYAFAEAAPAEAVELVTGAWQPDAWHAAMSRELERIVDPARALWGATLLSDAAGTEHLLVLRYHHAILDGESFNALLDELLACCDALMRGETPVLAPVALLPPVDGFLQPAAPAEAAEPAPPIAQHAPAPLARRRTGHHRVRLDAGALRRLKLRCRAQGLELNSLLAAALALCAHEAGLYGGVVDFKTAVSLRDCLPADAGPRNAPGCYVAVADTRLDARAVSLPELARSYQRALFAAVLRQSRRLRNLPPAALRAGTQATLESRHFSGFGLTNIGAPPLRHAWPGFELVDYLPLGRRVAGNHAFALHAAEFRGELLATWVYTEPLLDPALAGRMAGRFAGALDAYAS